jgi:hypothetical protein
MAIVANTGIPGGSLDKPLTTPNRKISGSPIGATTPLYCGEIVLDETSGALWYATDLTNTGWAPAVIG